MTRAFVPAALIAVLLVGCGGAGKGAGSSTGRATATTSARNAPPPTASLVKGVRQALRQNADLSAYVLWHNRVPKWARRSTEGPALRSLTSSAATRRKAGIRIRTQTQHLAVLSVQLDPSYLLATARVRATGRVAPRQKGRKLGRSIRLDELARVELHRIGRSARFVVWKVVPAR